jgi:hypothetical protein
MDSLATTFFKKEEFYNNEKVILKNSEQTPKRYIEISEFSLLDDAKRYLTDFTKNSF